MSIFLEIRRRNGKLNVKYFEDKLKWSASFVLLFHMYVRRFLMKGEQILHLDEADDCKMSEWIGNKYWLLSPSVLRATNNMSGCTFYNMQYNKIWKYNAIIQ